MPNFNLLKVYSPGGVSYAIDVMCDIMRQPQRFFSAYFPGIKHKVSKSTYDLLKVKQMWLTRTWGLTLRAVMPLWRRPLSLC